MTMYERAAVNPAINLIPTDCFLSPTITPVFVTMYMEIIIETSLGMVFSLSGKHHKRSASRARIDFRLIIIV